MAPKVIAHLIASDLGIQYDEALDISKDETVWEYGGVVFIYLLFLVLSLHPLGICSSYQRKDKRKPVSVPRSLTTTK
jgi:hypothetical protein